MSPVVWAVDESSPIPIVHVREVVSGSIVHNRACWNSFWELAAPAEWFHHLILYERNINHAPTDETLI